MVTRLLALRNEVLRRSDYPCWVTRGRAGGEEGPGGPSLPMLTVQSLAREEGIAMGRLRRSGSDWERLQQKATEYVERAPATQPFQVTFDVPRRTGSDMVAALDDEMEKRGYVFSGWLTPGKIAFRYRGLEEIERKQKLQEETLYAGIAYIVTDIETFRHPTKKAGVTRVAVTMDKLVLGGELQVPIHNNVIGYGVHKKPDGSLIFSGAIVLRGGYSGQPGPTALVTSLMTNDRFEDAMVRVGIPRVDRTRAFIGLSNRMPIRPRGPGGPPLRQHRHNRRVAS